jgi:predicted short-subunit dehydrogenase-like oxidoreductase (DUF2520 family)
MNIQHITIIGTGNVAFQLGNALSQKGTHVKAVVGRNAKEADELAKRWNCDITTLESIEDTDLALICVSDSAIIEVINAIPATVSVAYTSGSLELHAIPHRENCGVFYPLQTFSKQKTVNAIDIPFLIEANSIGFAQDLFDLAWKISNNVSFADSAQRKTYHLAAVWINNFTNHLAYQAKAIVEKNQLDWKNLMPLLQETIGKLSDISPFDAQTGPARRGDLETIHKHEAMQTGLQQSIYSLLSKSIIETYSSNK